MALPLLPFIAGAASGGLAMYLYKDQESKDRIRQRAADLSDKLFARMRRKQPEAADNDARNHAADIEGEEKALAPKTDDNSHTGGASI